jgi:hypothetical protein
MALCLSLIFIEPKESHSAHAGSIFTSLLSLVCAAIALGLFMENCWRSIDDNADGIEMEWGPGSVLTIIGLILMGFVCAAEVVSSCVKPDPTPQTSPAVAKANPTTPEDNVINTL